MWRELVESVCRNALQTNGKVNNPDIFSVITKTTAARGSPTTWNCSLRSGSVGSGNFEHQRKRLNLFAHASQIAVNRVVSKGSQ